MEQRENGAERSLKVLKGLLGVPSDELPLDVGLMSLPNTAE